jgi:transmembrane sensor
MSGRPVRIQATDSAADAAARWALRCAEGLDTREERALADWLAANPEHGRLLAEYRGAWDRFEPLATESGLASGRAPAVAPTRSWRRLVPVLAAAAAVAFGVWWQSPLAPKTVPAVAAAVSALPPPCERRTLADGTSVELNRGAELSVEFSASVRRVRLVRGEASFTVTKDPVRPFVVVAGALEARAVGTAFNVRREAATVEVLVTEGLVQVETLAARAAAPAPVLLGAGQQVVVAGAVPALPAVRTLSTPELEQRLAWQSRLLDFDDAPLSEIVAAFNRSNPVRLVVDDPGLAALRMTATFRSDNVESFVRLLEANYGVRVRAQPDGGIRLGRR